MTDSSARPLPVSEYWMRTGVSGNTSRSTMPSCSSLLQPFGQQPAADRQRGLNFPEALGTLQKLIDD